MTTRRFIAFSAEFPNDNAELHAGTIWMCVDLCGPAEAHFADRPGEVDLDDESLEPIEIVESFESLELDGAVELVPAPAPSQVVATVAEVTSDSFGPFDSSDLEQFFPPETLVDEPARIAPLVSTPPPRPDNPFDAFLQTLADVACDGGRVLAASEIGAALASDPVAIAWKAILSGEGEDFSLCSTPLDEWASAALARILDAPQKAAQLRRELRARGVAAFGLVEAAA